MCCFSCPVESVSETRIFARASTKGRQFLVYSMIVDASQELAMILPIPVPANPDEDAVRFINLEEYEDFFDEMESGFPRPPAIRSDPSVSALAGGPLVVEQVGSFEASFVPSIKDFGRLDQRFRLPIHVWNKLPKYRQYGFAVFQLMKEKHGAQKVHPMAFEFPRANPRQLFFPTVHIHDGSVHAKAEFDHVLYCQQSTAGEDVMMWKDLHETAASITTLYLRDGEKALVGGRLRVFQQYVILPFFTEDCRRCGCSIPGCERIGSWENGGYCGWCNHQLAKLDKD